MAYDLEEQEKIDALKAWWEQYGTLVTTVVFIAVAVFAGWRAWQWYESHQADQAMGYYEALESAAKQSDEDSIARIKAASETLRNDFKNSAYTDRGVLVAAWALEKQNDLNDAKQQLRWLVDSSKSKGIQAIAKLRLAGLLLDEGQYDDALKLVNQQAETGFEPLYADRLGDVYAAKGDKEQALKSWQNAIQGFGDDPAAQIVQLKIDALNGA